MHFVIASAKTVCMLIDSVVTPLVTKSEQALHYAITELELIAGGLESGKRTDGLQKTWSDKLAKLTNQLSLVSLPVMVLCMAAQSLEFGCVA